MRIAAIVANVIQIFSILYVINDEGMPSMDDDRFWLFAILSVVPVLNAIQLFGSNDESWLGLYLKRRALEERNRIDELESAKRKKAYPFREDSK